MKVLLTIALTILAIGAIVPWGIVYEWTGVVVQGVSFVLGMVLAVIALDRM